MTKAIAYFLPQYHEISENNDWWGKGFTEWTNLNKSVPLYDGHIINQPLNDNYYDLTKKETVIWQTNLANKYSLYAFCYYHYWFKGKKILETPAENLLKWNDIDQKFMFMWANHDWTRSWVGGKEILIKQEYGDENDWLEHIEYLIPFFKDKRYVKIGNKPVFQIYIPKDISNLIHMVSIWNDVCKRHGFDGIYIIETVRNFEDLKNGIFSNVADALSIQEHTTTLSFLRSQNKLLRTLLKIKKMLLGNKNDAIETYDLIVKNSLKIMKKTESKIKVFFGVSTGWDNTPRYGDRGYIITGSDPLKFTKYLQKAKDISEERESEFIFISCWNEWCEGMCLEPTKKDGHEYLKAVQQVFGTIKL